MCWGYLPEQSRLISLLLRSFCGTELCGEWLPSHQQRFLHHLGPSFSLKSSLTTLGHTVPPVNLTAVKACMIYLALSLCRVNCFLHFYSSLRPRGFTEDNFKGENHENGDCGFCICRFTAPDGALHRAG